MPSIRIVLSIFLLLSGCGANDPAEPVSVNVARFQVEHTERAFARAFAAHDLKAFGDFISEDALFYSGGDPLRGREAILDGWAYLFRDGPAPFSWEPDDVEVFAGTLALSTGPVRDSDGNVTGRFVSVWRREAPGVWRIVLDRGESAASASPEAAPGDQELDGLEIESEDAANRLE